MKSGIKKAAVGILTAIVILSIGGISTFATEKEDDRNFVDIDNDGVCDNCGMESIFCKECGRDFVDADNNGVCHKHVTRYETRHRRGFCDYRREFNAKRTRSK